MHNYYSDMYIALKKFVVHRLKEYVGKSKDRMKLEITLDIPRNHPVFNPYLSNEELRLWVLDNMNLLYCVAESVPPKNILYLMGQGNWREVDREIRKFMFSDVLEDVVNDISVVLKELDLG